MDYDTKTVDQIISVSASRGGSVLLPCSVQNELPPYTLEWHRQDTGVIYTVFSGATRGHPASGYEDKLYHATNSSLLVDNVQLEDSGLYQCLVKPLNRPASKMPGTTVQLSVNTLPQFIRTSPKVVYKAVGDSMSLFCEADGVPSPVIYWEKEKRPMNADSDRRIVIKKTSLHITNLRKTALFSDQGVYGCIASNSEGQIQHEMRLLFFTPPIFETVPQNMTALEGAQLAWSCRAQAEPANITYSWYFGDRKIIYANSLGLRSKILPNGDLHISKVRKEDTGWYKCAATNGHGPEVFTSAYLDVQYFPQILPSNPTIQRIPLGLPGSIHCDIDANPSISSVLWTNEGKVVSPQQNDPVFLSENGAKLNFRNVSYQDSGLYTCQAFNMHGKSAVFELHAMVNEPPHFVEVPVPQHRHKEGQSISVSCSGRGSPPPSVFWRKKTHSNDRRLPAANSKPETHAKLGLERLRKTDHGTYECVLQNEVATLTKELYLFIEDTTPQAPENLTVVPGTFDATVHWDPGYDGGHNQSFELRYRDFVGGSWTTVPVQQKTRFIATHLYPETQYEFVIVPRNKLGEGFKSSPTIIQTKEVNYEAPLPTVASGKSYLPDIKRPFGPKPNPPKNLVLQTEPDHLLLSWESPDQQSGLRIQYYTVEYREYKEKQKIERMKRAMHVVQRDGFSQLGKEVIGKQALRVDPKAFGVQGGSSYDFRVRANTLTSYSEPSNVVTYAVPGVAPQTALIAAVAGGLLFFLLCVVLAVLAVKFSRRRAGKTASRRTKDSVHEKGENGFWNGNVHTARFLSESDGHSQKNGCANATLSQNGRPRNGIIKYSRSPSKTNGLCSKENGSADAEGKDLFQTSGTGIEEADGDNRRQGSNGKIRHWPSRIPRLGNAWHYFQKNLVRASSTAKCQNQDDPRLACKSLSLRERATVATRWLFCSKRFSAFSPGDGTFSTASSCSSVPYLSDSLHLHATAREDYNIDTDVITPEQTCIRTLTKAIAKQESSLSEYLRTHSESALEKHRLHSGRFGGQQRRSSQTMASVSAQQLLFDSGVNSTMTSSLSSATSELVQVLSVDEGPDRVCKRHQQVTAPGHKHHHSAPKAGTYRSYGITASVNTEATQTPVNGGQNVLCGPPSNQRQNSMPFSVQSVGKSGYLFKFPDCPSKQRVSLLAENAVTTTTSTTTVNDLDRTTLSDASSNGLFINDVTLAPVEMEETEEQNGINGCDTKPEIAAEAVTIVADINGNTGPQKPPQQLTLEPDFEFSERAIDVPQSLLLSNGFSDNNVSDDNDINDVEFKAPEAWISGDDDIMIRSADYATGGSYFDIEIDEIERSIDQLRRKTLECLPIADLAMFLQQHRRHSTGGSDENRRRKQGSAAGGGNRFCREDPFRRGCNSRRQSSVTFAPNDELIPDDIPLAAPVELRLSARRLRPSASFLMSLNSGSLTNLELDNNNSSDGSTPTATKKRSNSQKGHEKNESHKTKMVDTIIDCELFGNSSPGEQQQQQQQRERHSPSTESSASSTASSSSSSGIGSHESYVLGNAGVGSVLSICAVKMAQPNNTTTGNIVHHGFSASV